jgi:hypothetical protein
MSDKYEKWNAEFEACMGDDFSPEKLRYMIMLAKRYLRKGVAGRAQGPAADDYHAAIRAAADSIRPKWGAAREDRGRPRIEKGWMADAVAAEIESSPVLKAENAKAAPRNILKAIKRVLYSTRS